MNKLTTLALLFVFSASVHAQKVDRYFAEFPIGYLGDASTRPFDGGGGGRLTAAIPIPRPLVTTKAIIRVEEAQNFTWEWIGIEVESGRRELMGFPNVEFTLDSSGGFAEYTGSTFDLNPSSPNEWVPDSGNTTFRMNLPDLSVSGTYASFSTNSDFSVEMGTTARPQFNLHNIEFSDFPTSLSARLLGPGSGAGYTPKEFVELEPKVKLSGMSLILGNEQYRDSNGNWTTRSFGWRDVEFKHTPTGDADNDGDVDFADFIILAENFGEDGAAGEAPAWEQGDFDENGLVDFQDFIGLASNFGTEQVAAVPEPSAAWLAFAALPALLARRRPHLNAAGKK